MQNFGPYVVSFIITLGWKHWYGVGTYVTNNNLPTVHWITMAPACGMKGMGKVLFVDLNA